MAEATTGTKRQFEEDFKGLPLDEKFCSLFRMEAATLEETVKVVAKAGEEVFEKVGEVLNDFGTKVQQEFNKERHATAEPAVETEPVEPVTPESGPTEG